MSWLDAFPFVCPRCRAPVTRVRDEAFACTPCAASYPVVLGIPDFRLSPDPWIGVDDDRAKGVTLERETAGASLEAMVRAYWRMTPDTSAERAERFIEHVMSAEVRSREWIAPIAGTNATSSRWLDLGCGTADLTAAVASLASKAPIDVVGLDVAFRWLVVARRRLALAGLESKLVCANAEALPFEVDAFDRVIALGVLEHVDDPRRALGEARRVLRPNGTIRLRIANRYSLLPEPHVGLFGVGWLPRPVAECWVRLRTGQSYRHHHPLGCGALRRALRAARFTTVTVEAAQLLSADRARLSRSPLRALLPAYEWVRRTPVLSMVLRLVAPLLDASATRA